MRFFKVMLLALAALSIVACQRVVPIYSVDHQPFPSAVEVLSEDKIEKVIIHAGAIRGWVVTRNSEGSLDAVLTPRTHMAKVQIDFDKAGFSIKYADSRELMYTGTTIHRNYNKWVKNLQNDILREVTLAASMAS